MLNLNSQNRSQQVLDYFQQESDPGKKIKQSINRKLRLQACNRPGGAISKRFEIKGKK